MSAKDREERFLREINQGLPQGMDWKTGAVTYLAQHNRNHGAGGEHYHLIKPFVGGPDFSPFVNEFSKFVAMIRTLNLPMRSEILDVGCGPGWVTEYFTKLGHSVLGVDLCSDLIAVAKRRIQATAFGAYPGVPLAAEFLVHDVEELPLPTSRTFDVAYFESTLHHFFNPLAVLRNVARNLRQDGVIAIIEGAAPPADSEDFKKMQKAMLEYHTLERAYSQKQLVELLQLTGFDYYRRYVPICGLYEPTLESAEILRQSVSNDENWNVVIASRTPEGLKRLHRYYPQEDDRLTFVRGFYSLEREPAGRSFRWSQGTGVAVSRDVSALELTIGGYPPALAPRPQKILVQVNHQAAVTISLTGDAPQRDLRLAHLRDTARGEISFESDSIFCPKWFGLPDSRQLSFWVEVKRALS